MAPPPTRYVKLPWGWHHIPHPDPTVLEIHIMPLSDCGLHAFDMHCGCRPFEDAESLGFITHRSFDGRETYESGERKRH